MGNPLVPNDFDALVASLLDGELRDSSLSLRELSRESDVKLTRLGDVLRRGKAMTVGELRAISGALGLTASAVVREAEEAVAGGEVAVVDPSPQTLASVHRLPAAEPSIPLDLAARTVHHRPERDAMHQWDNVGEESQVRDDEGEES